MSNKCNLICFLRYGLRPQHDLCPAPHLLESGLFFVDAFGALAGLSSKKPGS